MTGYRVGIRATTGTRRIPVDHTSRLRIFCDRTVCDEAATETSKRGKTLQNRWVHLPPPAPPTALLSHHITRGCGPWLILLMVPNRAPTLVHTSTRKKLTLYTGGRRLAGGSSLVRSSEWRPLASDARLRAPFNRLGRIASNGATQIGLGGKRAK